MEPGIVAVEPIRGENLVEVFTRTNGRLQRRFEKTRAFFYTNIVEPALDQLWDDDTTFFELEGDLHYNVMVETNNIKSAWWFKKNAQRGNFYMIRERGQYLLSSGKTLFKGMEFDDPVRMYFDFETYTTPGYKFTNPHRAGDKITIIAIKSNRGDKIALVLDDDGWSSRSGIFQESNAEELRVRNPDVKYLFFDNEAELLEGFSIVVDTIDPDIFINHNIFNFDLWFADIRYRMHDIPMELGRDRTVPNMYETQVHMGEKTRDIFNFEFYGRHVLDTEVMARQEDIMARRYDNYQLKYLVRELGLEHSNRIIIPGGRIASAWDGSDPEFNRFDLLSYALDDAEDAQKLDQVFGGASFESTKFTPYPLQDTFRLATGGKSETLFVRYYYDQAHSLPQPDKKRKYSGGFAGVGKFGFIHVAVVLIDVKSLYPTIGIEHNIHPYKDVLEFYQKIIKLFRTFRYTIKDAMEGAVQSVKTKLKATDNSVKPYLNTIAYGYLTSAFSLFNDFDEGERITELGQGVLKGIIGHVEENGGTVVKYDTDGAVCIPSDEWGTDEDSHREFVEFINQKVDKFEIGMDGRYKKSLIVDGKSYALLDFKDKVIIKGDTLKSRRKEHFILNHLNHCVEELLHENFDVLIDSLNHWVLRIKNKELTQEDISQYQEIKEPLETYRTKVELGSGNGGRNAAAAYEIACQMEENGMDIRVGDRIEYYVAEPTMTVSIDKRTGKLKEKAKSKRVCDMAKNIDEFDPETINVKHYIKRLYDSSEPLYMLFYELQDLKKMGFSMGKRRRDKLEEIKNDIFNKPLKL